MAAEGFLIANTCFDKATKNRTTFLGPDKVHKQLEYCLASQQMGSRVRDSQSTNTIDLRSDHKAIKMVISMTPAQRNRSKRKTAKCNTSLDYDWEQMETNTWQMLADILLEAHRDEKVDQIESLMIKAASESTWSRSHIKEAESQSRRRLTRLIVEQRCSTRPWWPRECHLMQSST